MNKQITEGFQLDDFIMNDRQHKKPSYIGRIAAASAVVILLAVFLGVITGMQKKAAPEIVLRVERAEIFQDEAVPEIKVSVTCPETYASKVSLGKGYTLEQLLSELNSGTGYELKYEIDNTKEGVYPIQIVMKQELADKISGVWKQKVTVRLEDSELVVKNKYGTWDGTKFKRHDGSYVVSDFIVSEGAEYYFDAAGEMCTGEQIIGGEKCTFDETGKLVARERYVDPEKPMLALTFDDGPGQYTDTLLEKLKENQSAATFFMIGRNVGDYPDTLKKMQAYGCELGNHSWSHTDLIKLSEEDIRREIDTTNQAIADVLGQGASLLRPPYGSFNAQVKALSGMPIMLWSVDTEDWKKKDAGQIVEYVLNTVSDGDVVLLHDIHSFSVEAALQLIPKLREMGYQLVTVSELAQARGIQMEAGIKYFGFAKE